MSIKFASICPHPPIIIPTIGSSSDLRLVSKTIQAMKELADIFAKSSDTVGEFDLYLWNGYTTFHVYDAADDNIYRGRYGDTPLDTDWHYLTATYDGSESSSGIKIFVDGEQEIHVIGREGRG